MPSINTKWFTSTMAGASSIVGNTGGGLIAVLTACLKDGFNLVTLDSLVVAGNVATATKSGHGFIVDQVVLIAGATPAGLNGEWRVTEVTSNTAKFTTSGISDQTATGTITAKTAPCGWLVPFTGTNQAVFKSGDVTSSQQAIRVDDSTAQYSTILAAESFTDISTEVNGYATQYMKRSSTTDATARPWLVVGDAKSVYVGIQWNSGGAYDIYNFGDFNSLIAGDVANFRLQALTANNPSSIGQYSFSSEAFCHNALSFCSRSYANIIGATGLFSFSAIGGAYSAGGNGYVFHLSGNHGYNSTGGFDNYATPALSDNGYHFFNVFLVEQTAGGKTPRGAVRGMLHVIEYLPQASGYQILTGVENVASGLVLMVRSGGQPSVGSGSVPTVLAFDLGDWA